VTKQQHATRPAVSLASGAKGTDQSPQALAALLEKHGLRNTEQRRLVLTQMMGLQQPISHPELTEQMRDANLDRATVYRTLLSLTEAGILVRVQLGDNVWRYELPKAHAAGSELHAHLVCNDCGDIECLPADAVKVSGSNMKARVAEIQLRGQCADCSE